MRRCKRRSFDFENFEITKREILASISIVAVMLLIGILIAGKISDYHLDKNEKYNKAIKIESPTGGLEPPTTRLRAWRSTD